MSFDNLGVEAKAEAHADLKAWRKERDALLSGLRAASLPPPLATATADHLRTAASTTGDEGVVAARQFIVFPNKLDLSFFHDPLLSP